MSFGRKRARSQVGRKLKKPRKGPMSAQKAEWHIWRLARTRAATGIGIGLCSIRLQHEGQTFAVRRMRPRLRGLALPFEILPFGPPANESRRGPYRDAPMHRQDELAPKVYLVQPMRLFCNNADVSHRPRAASSGIAIEPHVAAIGRWLEPKLFIQTMGVAGRQAPVENSPDFRMIDKRLDEPAADALPAILRPDDDVGEMANTVRSVIARPKPTCAPSI